MATTLYLRSSVPSVRPFRGPETQSVNLSYGISSADANTTVALSTSSGSGTGSTGSQGSTPSGPVTFPGIVLGFPHLWVSDVVSSSVTVSGTITLNLWAYESSMSCNGSPSWVIWRVKPDATASVIASKNYGTELTTSMTESSTTVTPTSTNLEPGDVIAVALFLDDATSVTMGNGYTWYYGYDGGTSTGQYDSYVSFTETISFSSPSVSGTTTNLLDDASDISGSGNKKMWTDSVSSATGYVVNTTNNIQWTLTAGGTGVIWYSPQLSAVDLTGYFKMTVRAKRDSSATGGGVRVEIAKTDSDGSNAVNIGSGRIRDSFTTSDANYEFYGNISGTLTDGQRLRVILYTTYPSGIQVNSGYTEEIRIEDSSGVTAIQWPATLSLYSPSVPKFRSVPSVAVSQSSRW